MKKLRIIVGGFIGLMPFGGVTWDYVQYPVGLLELGHDVFYIEDTGSYPIYQKEADKWDDCSSSVAYLSRVMEFFGMADRWAYRDEATETWLGLSQSKVQEITGSADVHVNISCSTFMRDEVRKIPVRILLDTDPMFTQLQLVGSQKFGQGDLGMSEMVKASNHYFTFGENIAAPDCRIPTAGLEWRPTRQPVCLKYWNVTPLESASSKAFTTVMNWAAAKRFRYAGESWGQKDVEFNKFLSLPNAVLPVKLAAAVAQAAEAGLASFPLQKAESKGWHILDPNVCAADWVSYRDFIKTSLGEFSVAKETYVKARTGWFSCRSACYLASGRPVITQETGWSKFIPAGKGVFAFENEHRAVEAIRAVADQWQMHSLAAREIAEEYFDSGRVLNEMLKQIT